MAAAEEKKLLCCFVVANEREYVIYAMDFVETRIRGEGNRVLNADDLSSVISLGGVNFHRDAPRLPAPVLTIPKYVDPYFIPDGMAFGFLDGKLYMLGGCNWNFSSSSSSNHEYVKVYVFDTNEIISSSPPPTFLDHKIHVTNGPELNAPKLEPLVIPLAGKLFVFSRTLESDLAAKDDLIEVLDPAAESKSWSRIPLPPNLAEFVANMVHDNSEQGRWSPCEIDAHATVGSWIVLCLPLDNRYKGYLFILDAETETWTQHVKNEEQLMPPFMGDNLFWDGIWFTGTSNHGNVLYRAVEEEEGAKYKCWQLSKTLVSMKGKVVLWVDDDDSTNLLAFFHGQRKLQIKAPAHPDYFRVDMVRVHKTNNEGAAPKMTGNVVKSMLFRFCNHLYPDFKFESCFYLIIK